MLDLRCIARSHLTPLARRELSNERVDATLDLIADSNDLVDHECIDVSEPRTQARRVLADPQIDTALDARITPWRHTSAEERSR
jgi:hypothetical protein